MDLEAIPRPSVTVDVVVLTIRGGRLQVLLIERGGEPFLGCWALPGGFVHVGAGDVGGESLDEAAARELREETGLPDDSLLVEQLAVFGTPARDPRGRTITVAFFALVRPELAGFVKGGTDAAAAAFVDVDAVLGDRSEREAERGLAFDHDAILRAALLHLKGAVQRGEPQAFHLVPKVFTIRELQEVHEVLLQQRFGAGPFRKRFDRLLDEGKVERAEGKRVTAKRPAMVFRAL